jgi:hypothetical protein
LAGWAQAGRTDTLEQARDFTYTMAPGRTGTLYELPSEWVLLYFYDPTCEDCHALTSRLAASECIRELIAAQRLTVLAVYPEEATEAWTEQAGQTPDTWINGYDPGATIYIEGLYMFRSLPALYLLDRDKKIRLQEAPLEAVEKELKLLTH